MGTAASEEVLWEATFNPKVRTYWLWSGALVLVASIVGIVLLPIWFAVGYAVTDRYLKRMRCTLTSQTLQVGKGLFVRTEKTVPLEKITDLGVVHGPIMRYFGLQALSIETAGQSSAGALVKLVGIDDTTKFREAVLAQREVAMRLQAGKGAADSIEPARHDDSETSAVLAEIRDAVLRIEQSLAK